MHIIQTFEVVFDTRISSLNNHQTIPFQGLIFGVVLNKDKVKEGVLISVENAGSEMVPVIGELVKNSEVSQLFFN